MLRNFSTLNYKYLIFLPPDEKFVSYGRQQGRGFAATLPLVTYFGFLRLST
ncbi:MAG: hypothetical protein ACKO9I_15850 [Sphaerospermopsis kisseleviana]